MVSVPWAVLFEDQLKNSVAPVKPTVSNQASVHSTCYYSESMSISEKSSLQHRLNRWRVGARHRFNDISRRRWSAMTMWQVQCDRLNWYPSIGLTDDSWVNSSAYQKNQRLVSACVWPVKSTISTGLTDAYVEKGITASNSSMYLVAYIYMPSSGHFGVTVV